MMQAMSIIRALRVLASQQPTKPPAKVVSRSLVTRRSHRDVPVTWIDADAARDGAIVHFHGGGYIEGETPRHWAWLEELRRRSATAGAMVHYRMPPRFPFPAAYDDAFQAVRGMIEDLSVHGGRWVLSGDSAGAGLALALAQQLRDREIAGPSLILLTSPWADLTDRDRLGGELKRAADLYTDGMPADDPRISPLFGDLSDLAPIHLTSGGKDAIVSDAHRLAEAVEAAGGTIEHHVEAEGGHDFPFHRGVIAQAAQREQILAVRTALGLQRSAETAH